MDISVIIPAYHRKAELGRCLDSLFQQDYPKDRFEIIVVNDGSGDGIEEMLRGLSEKHPNLSYLFQPHKGPAAARNLGLGKAKGEIVCFTDTDCILNFDWVRKMVEAHRSHNDVMTIGGRSKVDSSNIKVIVSQFLSDGAIATKINGEPVTIFFPTCNFSLKKNYLNGERFNELFPLPAGEDLEFCWRLFKKGYSFMYRQDIEILHQRDAEFSAFLKQAYMYGRGNYLVQCIHRDHPLLKEVKTQNNFSFVLGLIINFIKIPRFSYLLGTRLIRSQNNFSLYERLQIYIYFILHKIVYLIGNTVEHWRMVKIDKDAFQEISKETKDIPAKPEFIILDITHRCNLKCNICEIRKDKAIKEFATDEIKNLITQAIEWRVKEFVLSGGEPFIREDIFEILDFVKEKNYHIGILTNGILLSEEFIKRLLPYLVSNALSLSISLDALMLEIHDDIRGAKGCFEKTFNGLKILSEFKKQYPSINFNTISIILNGNLEELLPLASFLKSLNVNSIQFQPLLSNNLIMKERSNRVKYWIPKERLAALDKVIDALVEFKQQNFNLVQNSENNLSLMKKYFRGLLIHEDVRCLYATKTMLIANNGNVTTCFDCYGNVRKVPLQKIFKSKEAEWARKRVWNCKNPCLLPCFTDGLINE